MDEAGPSGCDKTSIFWEAALEGDLRLLKRDVPMLVLLMSAGASVDIVSDYGTPLHRAIAYRHKEAVQVLLDHQADAITLATTRLAFKRSMCWVHLNNGLPALYDARLCIGLRPDSSKAHCMEGAAWKILQNYPMAAAAYSKARQLLPYSEEIIKLYQEASDLARNWPFSESSSKDPMESEG
ncbi:UNVERIFIED_CONTAM: hypothetical protein Sindi_1071100 [Sesamum indicum]